MERVLALSDTGATPVIIVNDPNLASSTRTRALIDEANKHPDCRFIIVAKNSLEPMVTVNLCGKL